MALLYILEISLVCGLTRGNLILQFDSSLKLLPYVVLIEVYGQNPTSHRYVAGKGRTWKSPQDSQGSYAHTLRTTALN